MNDDVNNANKSPL